MHIVVPPAKADSVSSELAKPEPQPKNPELEYLKKSLQRTLSDAVTEWKSSQPQESS